jgi:hypothetical protein
MSITPRLVIEATDRGVETVTVRVRPGQRAAGMEMLEALLPHLRQLDRAARSQVPPADPAAPRVER